MNKSRLIILVILLFWELSLVAQNKMQDEFSDMSYEFISLKKGRTDKVKMQFSSLSVLDARFDTSCLGFLSTAAYNYKLAFKQTAGNEIREFILNHFLLNPNTTDVPGLLIVLKKFWVTSAYDASEKNLLHDWESAIFLNVDLYAQSINGFRPIKRFDSTIIVSAFNRKNIQAILSTEVLNSLNRLLLLPLKPGNKKEMIFEDIVAYNDAQFNLAILKAPTVTRGVYLNFNDFKTNEPSYKDFNLGLGSLGDMLYVKDDAGSEFPVRNVWGYSDGKNFFIRMSDNYFPLYKAGNTFNVFAAKEITRKRRIKLENMLLMGAVAGGTGAGNKRVTYNITPKPYQVDMVTGEVF